MEGSQHAALAPPDLPDYDFLLDLAIAAGDSFPWRGQQPNRAGLHDALWSGSFEHAVIQSRAQHRRIGYVALKDLSLFHGHCFLSVFLPPQEQRRGVALGALAFLLARLFQYTNVHKVFLESTESDHDTYSANGLVEQEARIRDFYYVRGERQDKLISSISRSTVEHQVVPAVNRWAPKFHAGVGIRA